MFTRLRRTRQLRRARPGDGSALKPFRWWQLVTRTLFDLEPAPDGTRPATYTVDVRYLAAELEGGTIPEGSKHAQVSLYRDGVQEHIANPPVAFAVPDGVIEVATSSYGLTRMHHAPEGGSPRALRPHPRTLEGLRARFGRRFPRASALVGATAVVVLLVGLVMMVPQAAELITQIEVVAENVGTFTSPISLPVWLNVTLVVAGVLAATERALTLRNHWLIDAETTWTSFA